MLTLDYGKICTQRIVCVGLGSMAKKTPVALALGLAVLGWASGARADLSSVQVGGNRAFPFTTISSGDIQTSPESASKHAHLLEGHAAAETAAGVDCSALWLLQDDSALFAALGDEAVSQPTAEVRDFPPLPSSAALYLSALLSAGAWHLGRSAKNLHLTDLPDWYHTGAPSQIGHVVAFDLDFSAPPLCCFEQPVGERPFLYRVERDLEPRRDAQCSLIIAAPRGPPALS